MSMTFAEALKEQLIARKKNRGKFARLIKLIDEKPSKKRTKVLNRLEQHARLYLKQEGYASIADVQDWSTVGERDWSAFFDTLMKFIMAILPLLLAFL